MKIRWCLEIGQITTTWVIFLAPMRTGPNGAQGSGGHPKADTRREIGRPIIVIKLIDRRQNAMASSAGMDQKVPLPLSSHGITIV
jgi:hypothetical protein